MAHVARWGLLFLLVCAAVLLMNPRETAPAVTAARVAEVLLPASPATPKPALQRLADFNRQAAAQVALIALAPAGQRPDRARAVAAWMGRQHERLPQAAGYTARQGAILERWQRALIDYAAGRPGGLVRIQALAKANLALFEALTIQVMETDKEGSD